ncbi:hypothetical protein HYFRA_00012305 [Hymenoscyphus fraxineus]|uniref:Uncharacterized protein n=1 Tax=Hymenoscyphus fraxineus TaxID=746836 RepID=A0A9N9L345_9HELO|nr:hypothetical protein HYFRA_00012305 [Hymenoscyphus fraxineus]
MSVQAPNFSILQDEMKGLQGDVQHDTLGLLEKALKSTSTPNIEQQTQSFVTPILKSYKETEHLYNASQTTFAQQTYDAILLISTCIPSGHHAQDILQRALPLLQQAGEAWNLGEFGMLTREIWNEGLYLPLPELFFVINQNTDPLHETNPANAYENQLNPNQWLNLNSFIAKCFENNLSNAVHGEPIPNVFANFGLWELRRALETPGQDEKSKEIQAPNEVVDMRVKAACEWIVQATKMLLVACLHNSCGEHSNGGSDGSPYGPGELFSGSVGFSLERWGFWKRRIVELKGTVGDDVHGVMDEALKKMTAVEFEAAEALVFKK